jgi:protein-S-isoprenylcysteine O-methyltransferase Ste14
MPSNRLQPTVRASRLGRSVRFRGREDMPLIEELEASGRWLFRWRSYLPLLILVPIFASLAYFRYPFGSALLDDIWEWFCLLVGLSGWAVRGVVAGYVPRGTSGRNRKEQVAETLNITGMYSIVRNPLYVGNFLMGLSVPLFLRVWWVLLIYLLSFTLYYERIVLAEEMFLRQKFGEEYLVWASRTPAFLPRLSLWQRPSLAFSWRTFVRREYQSAFGLIIALFVLEQLTELHMGNGWHVHTMWKWIVCLAIGGYLITRFLHKKTSLLGVEGR